MASCKLVSAENRDRYRCSYGNVAILSYRDVSRPAYYDLLGPRMSWERGSLTDDRNGSTGPRCTVLLKHCESLHAYTVAASIASISAPRSRIAITRLTV